MSYTRRLLIGAALAGTTSVATKKPAPSSPQASPDWKAVRQETRARAREAGERRLRIGVIGAGVAGSVAVQRLINRERSQKDVELVAVCDVYQPRLERAVARAHLESRNGHADFTELLRRKDVDAVMIATPPHWHFQMSMDAMAAGKDVWAEPPMALSIEEAQQLRQAAVSLKRVYQMNTPELQDPRFQRVRELIHEGAVGRVLMAQVTVCSNSVAGEWNEYVEEEATPGTVNWDLWQGPAVKRPFSGERFFRWRKYWDYSGGPATEMLLPRFTPLLAALGPPWPVRVSANGGIYQQKDREVPDTYFSTIEYPDFQVNLSALTAAAMPQKIAHEAAIFGNTGSIIVTPNAVQLHAEPAWEPKLPESRRGVHAFDFPPMDLAEEHMNDFVDAVRARRQPMAGVDFALHATTAILLGVDSYRQSRLNSFDGRTRRLAERPSPRPGYEGTGRNHPEGRKRRV